jgi:CheY-like chemotaxis protein
MSVKTILIAHRSAEIRDRFAAALTDARHAFVLADTSAEAMRRAADPSVPVSLVLVDLGLAEDAGAFARTLRRAAGTPVPVLAFAGTVPSAADIPALAALGAGYINEHAATPHILPALAPHLFPDNFNRRASPRVALGVPVSFRSGATIAGAITLDIGRGGLAIRTMNPLPKRSAIAIRFRLPSSASDIEVEGRVAWGNRQVGMGIQFERISSADQAAIDAYVDDRGR